jgi:hypothetical protein
MTANYEPPVNIPNSTTRYNMTSLEAMKLHLNKKPGNTTINKTPTCKSLQM